MSKQAMRNFSLLLECALARLVLEGEHKYSSTQVNVGGDLAERILEFGRTIPDEELAEDGREDRPHCTLKYGLHTGDPEEVRAVLAGEGPITLTLGKTSLFPASEEHQFDVLKIDVDSDDLVRLNKVVSDALEHADTHPEYHPHLTIAYLKPGDGKKYDGRDDFEGETMTMDEVVFSDQEGNKTIIRLSDATEATE